MKEKKTISLFWLFRDDYESIMRDVDFNIFLME